MPKVSKEFLLAVLLVATVWLVFTVAIKIQTLQIAIKTTSDSMLRARAPRLIVKNPPAPSGISDWKTYRNEKYGFEVKYLPTWNLNEVGKDYLSQDKLMSVTFGQLYVYGYGADLICEHKNYRSGGFSRIGKGKNTNIVINGENTALVGEDKMPSIPAVGEGDTPQFLISYCGAAQASGTMCMHFYSYAPLDGANKQSIESSRFLKNWDSWRSECALEK